MIVSTEGGRNPRWGPEGGELYYWNEGRLIAARLALGEPAPGAGSSTVLQAPYASADHPNYDVHPDGKRFVVVTGRARPQRIIVAINPFARGAQRP